MVDLGKSLICIVNIHRNKGKSSINDKVEPTYSSILHTCRFQKRGLPPNHPFLDGIIFGFIETPILMGDLHIMIHIIYAHKPSSKDRFIGLPLVKILTKHDWGL